MNRIEKINKLENIKQKYINLRKYILYYYSILNNDKEKNVQKEPVKKLILTKSFYGKQIKVD